jgi:hypothetical protein
MLSPRVPPCCPFLVITTLPKVSLPGTVEAKGTYRTGLEANPASRDHSEQTPWRSYSGLASPAPRTCPPWRSVSMLGRGPVQLPRPALGESESQYPGRSQDWFAKPRLDTVEFTVHET